MPVIGWDLLTDVAVLGPVQLDSPPALPPFDTSNALPVGAELFTIGYPGEVEPFPQPTISRGILSRYRRWPEQEITYLQTDAAVNEGQSGGVLVSAAGAVVGMTVFAGHFGDFGTALSAAEFLPRVAALLAGAEDPRRRGALDLAAWAPATTIPFELDHLWAEQAFAIDAPLDAEVSFTLQGVSDLAAAIVDWTGYYIAEADETEFGTESISAVLEGVAPFLLLVEQFDDGNVLVELKGDARLVPLHDSDDGVVLDLPDSRVAAIDYPYDVDHYRIYLPAGETVRVLVDSVLIDPLVRIDYYDSPIVAEDDDSGGGLFGLSAQLIFQLEMTSDYRIVIEDPSGVVGGYTLTIEREHGS